MSNLLKTVEQERAKAAWKNIDEVNADPNDDSKRKYRTLVQSFPAMIQNAGLGQALAFLCAKARKEPAHKRLYDHLSSWIAEQKKWPQDERENLLKWLTENSSQEYRHVTVEIIAYTRWLKRFAEAELPEGGEV
jgi:CRISPR-associated protein Cmr5